MNLIENHIYHVYNRGNNRQPIFFSDDNFKYSVRKMRTHLLPVCDLLAYCLMPNHFHLLVKANRKSIEVISPKSGPVSIQAFSRGIQIMLSSYTRAIHKQEKLTGSLFQQRTCAKQVSSEFYFEDYSLTCFCYILNNPVAAGLVNDPSEWLYSSYYELAHSVNDPLCNPANIYRDLSIKWENDAGMINTPISDTEILQLF